MEFLSTNVCASYKTNPLTFYISCIALFHYMTQRSNRHYFSSSSRTCLNHEFHLCWPKDTLSTHSKFALRELCRAVYMYKTV